MVPYLAARLLGLMVVPEVYASSATSSGPGTTLAARSAHQAFVHLHRGQRRAPLVRGPEVGQPPRGLCVGEGEHCAGVGDQVPELGRGVAGLVSWIVGYVPDDPPATG